MNFSTFFSSVAETFTNHYRQLSESISIKRQPLSNQELIPEETKEQEPTTKTDSYIPSNETPTTTEETPVSLNEPQTETAPADTEDGEAPVPAETDQPEPPVTDYTTMLKRKARLEYQMNLQFDLSAITQTIEKISDGDTQALEEFAAAGFGLRAAMDFKGHQLINAKGEFSDDSPVNARRMMLSKAMNARQFAYQDRNFGVESFYHDSTRIQKNMNYESHGNHRLAVNKFALRYQMDSSLNFASLTRFNAQTEQMAGSDPANLNSYLTSAGNVAEKSSTEMMTVFFDAVDAYLDSAEEQLVARATEFFDMAAKELGFSGELVDNAREQFVGTIESFFDKVDTTIESMKTQFVPQVEQLPVTDAPEIPAIDYYTPAVTQNKAELAIA